MTTQTHNRQPKGTPVGGQFSETTKAAPEGVELTEEPVDPIRVNRYTIETAHGMSQWFATSAEEAIFKRSVRNADKEIFSISQTDLPPIGAEEADPDVYDGPDVDALAQRDLWGPNTWTRYARAQHERDLAQARFTPVEFEGAQAQLMTSEIDGALLVQVDTIDMARGRKVRVVINDGEVYDGDPEVDETIDQKIKQAAAAGPGYAPRLNATMEIFQAAQSQMERMSAGLVTEMVRASYPKASYLTLEHSDQGDYWAGVEVLGDDREAIGDWKDIECGDYEDDAIALSNFDSEASYEFITPSADGRTVYFDLDGAEKFARGEV